MDDAFTKLSGFIFTCRIQRKSARLESPLSGDAAAGAGLDAARAADHLVCLPFPVDNLVHCLHNES